MQLRLTVIAALLIAVLGLTACGSDTKLTLNSPIQTVRQFMNALNTDNPSKALDQVCESMAIPSLPEKKLKNLDYVENYIDGVSAEVRVTGEIRLEDEDLGAFKKNLDFTLALEKNGKNWCINRESLLYSLETLIDFSY